MQTALNETAPWGMGIRFAFSSTTVKENEGVAAMRQATLIRVAFRWVRIHHPKYPYQNKNTIQWMVLGGWGFDLHFLPQR